MELSHLRFGQLAVGDNGQVQAEIVEDRQQTEHEPGERDDAIVVGCEESDDQQGRRLREHLAAPLGAGGPGDGAGEGRAPACRPSHLDECQSQLRNPS